MIVGICRSKNNQAIIEPFVRHHLKMLDRLLICDNGSVDATKEILAKLAAEDSRLIISHDDSFGDFQTKHYEKLLIAAAAYQPEYLIPLDADEFLGTRSRASLQSVLGRIPVHGKGIMYWRTYVVTGDTEAVCAFDSPAGFRWRRKEELPKISKAIIRCERASVGQFKLSPGNHDAGLASGERMPSVELDTLPLLHFPITCREQLLAKTVIHWMAFLARDANARSISCDGDGWQTVRNFDALIKSGGKITTAQLCEMSLMYAQDLDLRGERPSLMLDQHGITYERRYSGGQGMKALPLIAKTWEQSLTVATTAVAV